MFWKHLDQADMLSAFGEMRRVLRPGGIWFGSVSCRPSGTIDHSGENLHRTVRGVDWWLEQLEPDLAEFDAHLQQLTLFKRPRALVQP
jgi:hypothetical protein